MSNKKDKSQDMTVGQVFAYLYRKVLLPSSLLYVIINFLMMIVSEKNAIKLDSAMLIFVFSLAVGFSNLIFSLKKVNILMRATMHFVSLCVSFAVIMLMGSGNMKTNSSGSILLLVAFAFAYLLIAPAFVYMIYKKEKNNSDKKVEYKSIYRNEK